MSTSENDTSYPLGYCQKCNRMRWIQEVDHEVPVEGGKTQPPMPVGRCTQCVREGWGSGSELLGPAPSENFSDDQLQRGNIRMLREIRTTGGDADGDDS